MRCNAAATPPPRRRNAAAPEVAGAVADERPAVVVSMDRAITLVGVSSWSSVAWSPAGRSPLVA